MTSYGTGVPIELAQARADAIANVHYELTFSIPSDRLELVRGSAVVTFILTRAGSVVFDFAQSPDHVLSVRSNGGDVEYAVEDEHITIAEVPAGQASVEIEFFSGDQSLNRPAGSPKSSTDPRNGLSSPNANRKRVVLPLPLGPRIAAKSPL